MKLPTEITIKGKIWKVKRKWNLRDDSGAALDGLCDFSTRTIFIDHTVVKDEVLRIFLHEFNHAALYELHLAVPEGAEEVLCDGLASVYVDTFNLKFKN